MSTLLIISRRVSQEVSFFELIEIKHFKIAKKSKNGHVNDDGYVQDSSRKLSILK